MSYHMYTYSRSFPSGKAAGEEVPMEDNPAYGDVNIYDNVQEPKENWMQMITNNIFHWYFIVWHYILNAIIGS